MSGGFSLDAGVCNANSNGVDAANTRGTAVTAANGSYGSYSQLVASTASDTQFVIVIISTNASSNSGNGGSITIGVGAAASEVVLIQDLEIEAPNSTYYQSAYAFPVQIPAGSRIAAAANGNGGADTFYVEILLFDTAFAAVNAFAGVDSIGATNNGSRGSTVTAGAANTKGSYTQLVASSSKDYSAIGFTLCYSSSILPTDRALLDIAIGGAGSEIIIIPDYFFSVNSPSGVNTVFCIMTQIPAGTRIAARIASATGSNAWGVVAYGLYQ